MNALLVAGTVVVTCALGSYTAAFVMLARSRRAGPGVRGWQTLGAALDAAATGLMIAGSRHIPITWHGFLGYTALALMLVETASLWRRSRRKGAGAPVPRGFFRYSVFAYSFWALTYVAGALIAVALAGGGR